MCIRFKLNFTFLKPSIFQKIWLVAINMHGWDDKSQDTFSFPPCPSIDQTKNQVKIGWYVKNNLYSCRYICRVDAWMVVNLIIINLPSHWKLLCKSGSCYSKKWVCPVLCSYLWVGRDVIDTLSIDASHISLHWLVINTNWSLIDTSKVLENKVT